MTKSLLLVVTTTLLLLIACLPAAMGLLNIFSSPKKQRQTLKVEILELAKQTDRGLEVSTEEAAAMQTLFSRLEKLNPTRAPLASGLVTGIWDLKYTTSKQILGSKNFRRVGPILQTLDTERLTAENAEVVDYGIFRLSRKVNAELTPVSPSEVAVQFKQFTFGDVVKINAPEAFKGRLDITYVDENFRLSRGDKGNIFVLTRV